MLPTLLFLFHLLYLSSVVQHDYIPSNKGRAALSITNETAKILLFRDVILGYYAALYYFTISILVMQCRCLYRQVEVRKLTSYGTRYFFTAMREGA